MATENLNRECWKKKNDMIIIKEICQWIFSHGIHEFQEPALPVKEDYESKQHPVDSEMQRLLRILLCFSCFGLLKLNADHERMEMNFRKQKEFFVQNRPTHKNLSQFFNNYQGLKDSI